MELVFNPMDHFDTEDVEWMTTFWRRVSFDFIPVSFLRDEFLAVEPGRYVIPEGRSICIDLIATGVDGQV